MKFGEYLVGWLIAILTLPLFLIGMLVGLRSLLRYARIKSM